MNASTQDIKEIIMLKRWFPLAASAAAALLLAASTAFAAGEVGSTAAGFTLKGVDGRTYSLADFKGKLVVLEWANPKCPFSDRHAREKTMTELARQHGEVVWLGVNSTNPGSGDFESPADYRAYLQKNAIAYPVLYDETGSVGHEYGAKTTPHMFIIDAQGKIVYNGAIDDDPSARKPKAERVNYVGNGLHTEEAGAKPSPAATKPYGCTVKY
jgi:peroxiredoxin